MLEIEPHIAEELDLLVRLLRSPQFRFVVVQQNHYRLIKQTEEYLIAQYPDRPNSVLRVRGLGYSQITEQIYQQASGLVFIEDFQEILKDPDIYIGLNQRRDKLAEYPIALIAFLPEGKEALGELVKKMPDLWSFRNMLLDLHTETAAIVKDEDLPTILHNIKLQSDTEPDLEIDRIRKRLEELEDKPQNKELQLQLIGLLVAYLERKDKYHEAIKLLNKVSNHVKNRN